MQKERKLSTTVKISIRRTCQVELEPEVEVEREGREVSSSNFSVTAIVLFAYCWRESGKLKNKC
jgi:hypothetical protein